MSNKQLYMIGHSIHPWEVFVNLLQCHSIAHLIDVRSSPRSRNPQYSLPRLQSGLAFHKIEYSNPSQLGGRRPLPAAEMQPALQDVLSNGGPGRLCLMCSEGDYHECHRHYLITPLAINLGWEVLQILKAGELEIDLGPTAKTLKKNAKGMPGAEDHPGGQLTF